MNEILKKIDELKTKKHQGYLHNGIEQSRYLGMLDMANEIIKILSEQSSQKEPCKNCIGPGLAVSRGITDMRIDKSDIPRQITIGDKIRESNESLAIVLDEFIAGYDCADCKARKFGCSEDGRSCRSAWLSYLNQPLNQSTS